jgi:site-specific DNA-methyltransferase (adenine-specific)
VIQLYQGDCLEVMPALPPASVDLILADPPYGTTACKWDSVIPFAPMWEAIKCVIKPNGAVVLFGSQPFTSALVMSNPTWFKYCWVWEKNRASNFFNAGNRPLTIHEEVVVFSGGTIANGSPRLMKYFPQMRSGKAYRKVNYETRRKERAWRANGLTESGICVVESDGARHPVSVLKFDSSNHQSLHPTQKPVSLLAYFIRTYTQKGETVLDFVMGSGSTGAACIEEERDFIGIEKDATYFDIARRRLEAEQSKPRTMRMEMLT